MFRTADAAGVREIILSGYTPSPIDRFGRERGDFAKVALGAQHTVAWRSVAALRPTLTVLRKKGVTIAALEQDKGALNVFCYSPTSPLALIVGNEVRGISKATRKLCDVILEIPMHGSKESLNVSVSAGVALFTLKHKGA